MGVYYNYMKSGKGFTVLELLVVIGIIGLLVALALVGLNKAREKSRDDSRISNLRQVRIALEDYRTACRNYPMKLDPAANNCPALQGATFAEFLPIIPTNPGGTSFEYYAYADPASPDQCIGYHIAVQLETVGHQALNTDDDFNSAADTSITSCFGSTSPFDASDDTAIQLYDFHR